MSGVVVSSSLQIEAVTSSSKHLWSRELALSKYTEIMVLVCFYRVGAEGFGLLCLCPGWSRSNPTGSISLKCIVMAHIQNVTSSLQLAPGGTVCLLRLRRSTGSIDGGEKKEGLEKHITAL